MSRIKDALIIDQRTEEPPEDEVLFEPGGECPEMDDEIIEEFFDVETVPF
ncbi:hypothetical protein [Methylocaldum gracile]|jgi:hypothetical protein